MTRSLPVFIITQCIPFLVGSMVYIRSVASHPTKYSSRAQFQSLQGLFFCGPKAAVSGSKYPLLWLMPKPCNYLRELWLKQGCPNANPKQAKGGSRKQLKWKTITLIQGGILSSICASMASPDLGVPSLCSHPQACPARRVVSGAWLLPVTYCSKLYSISVVSRWNTLLRPQPCLPLQTGQEKFLGSP